MTLKAYAAILAASGKQMNLHIAQKFALVSVAGMMLVSIAGTTLISANTTKAALPRHDGPSQIFFWAWDESEDMRPLAGGDAGVAYLAATMLLDESLHIRPRLEPLALAAGTPMMAVVRIETRRGFRDTPQLRQALIAAILDATGRSGIHAVQLDFDATRSERPFYAAVLGGLRAGLPRSTMLSITALLSWCAHDDWISTLPIDEAVPMYFRLGREAHNILNGDSAYAVREPLCSTSAGVATDEPSRNLPLENKRVYIFNPRSWTARQLKLLAQGARP